MRNIGRYLAVAGLIGYFAACTSEKRDFGADAKMAAAGQMNTGGAPASTMGGAAGTGMLMAVKVPCKASAECDDKNPCNGLEICASGFCAAEGMNKADGTACQAPQGAVPVGAAGAMNMGGAGGAEGPSVVSPSNEFFCTKGSCARGYCGDKYVDAAAGEECDDANTNDDDGCRKDCRFTCESTADCDDGNPCNGAEICLPATHMCATGVVPPNGTICDANNTKECRQSTCVNIGCGNGTVQPDKGEECDDSNVTAGDGCEIDCKWTCKSDADCSDKNACNGTETCDLNTHLCQAGVAVPVVDDGNACTDDVCNPADGATVHTLKDADGDGEASTALGACGTDCNDADGAIFSKSQEICGDGKDNDCNPATGDMDSSTRYYLDCDGDGFSADPSNYVISCGFPPPPKAGLCKPGFANAWTTTPPDPSGPRNWDCNDEDVRVNPTQTQYFADYYISPITGDKSWDYDCDGRESQYMTSSGVPTDGACDKYSCAYGYAGAAAPSCGQQDTYSECQAPIIIYYPPVTLAQSTIIFPPIYYLCDANATYRYVDKYHTQTCR